MSYLLSPTDWPLADAIRALKANTLDAVAEIMRAENFKTYATQVTTTLPAIAQATRNTVAELLALNYFDDATSIPAGAALTVFAR